MFLSGSNWAPGPSQKKPTWWRPRVSGRRWRRPHDCDGNGLRGPDSSGRTVAKRALLGIEVSVSGPDDPFVDHNLIVYRFIRTLFVSGVHFRSRRTLVMGGKTRRDHVRSPPFLLNRIRGTFGEPTTHPGGGQRAIRTHSRSARTTPVHRRRTALHQTHGQSGPLPAVRSGRVDRGEGTHQWTRCKWGLDGDHLTTVAASTRVRSIRWIKVAETDVAHYRRVAVWPRLPFLSPYVIIDRFT